MNIFTVTIQYYDGTTEKFQKLTKWERPDRLAKHYMNRLDKRNVMWRNLTVEWGNK